jgi:hypothetical protein
MDRPQLEFEPLKVHERPRQILERGAALAAQGGEGDGEDESGVSSGILESHMFPLSFSLSDRIFPSTSSSVTFGFILPSFSC